MMRRGMGPAGPSMAMVRARLLDGIRGKGPSPWRLRSRTNAGGTDIGSGRAASFATISAFWTRISSLTAEGSKRVGSIMRSSDWVAFVAGPCDEAYATTQVHYAFFQ